MKNEAGVKTKKEHLFRHQQVWTTRCTLQRSWGGSKVNNDIGNPASDIGKTTAYLILFLIQYLPHFLFQP